MIIILVTDATNDIGQWAARILQPLPSAVRLCSCRTEEEFLRSLDQYQSEVRENGAVVIPVFLDGTSDGAKSIILGLKAWCAAVPNTALQAMNAKQGQHTLFANEEAVVATVAKRLPVKAAPAAAAAVSNEVLDKESLDAALKQGQGETLWTLSFVADGFETEVTRLHELAVLLHCSVIAVSTRCENASGRLAQDFLVRKNVPGQHIELRLAVCGNVDSGKSTLTSVLTHGQHDDGRGSARAKVFIHQHELETGRTSSVSENHIGFDSQGNVVNHAETSKLSAAAIAQQSTKISTLYDLAGHEKYLKTTVLGMTRNVPDYACIVISANNGIQRMTKEHLGLCLALHLPFFVVVTRIDATPPNVLQSTMETILKLLKAPTVKKLPLPIKNDADVLIAARNLKADRIAPVFEVSNVTGVGIPALLRFLNILPTRSNWSQYIDMPKEMIIDSTFFVTGVGTVVGGIVTRGVFRPNDTVLLGPDGLGNFRPVQIKSIHSKGVEVPLVECGNDAAFCLKKEKRSAIRKGNVLVDPVLKPKAVWIFEAEIRILYHSTTISNNYEPVIHSQTVRQSARIVSIDRDALRTGDHAVVRFHFLYRPEYMHEHQRIIFREGRTKGIGTVLRLIPDEPNIAPGSAREAAKKNVRDAHEKQH
jgi:GTPase